MQAGNGRAQSRSTFDRRQTTPATFSSPTTYLKPAVSSTRSSSITVPSPKTGPRFRTVLHPESHVDRELRQKLHNSRARLQSSFDAIAEKYASVLPEEDDEVDLGSFMILRDNGHLKSIEPRPFAEGSDYLGEAIEDDQDGIRLDVLRLQSDPVIGPELVEFGEEEDELGDWGDKSGLDAQYPVTEIENEWTVDDLHDLDDFLRAEAARRERYGERPLPELENRGVRSSSPLRRLSRLVLDTSPEGEGMVMDENELSQGGHVNSDARERYFHHRSSTPPPTTHHCESCSSPRRRRRVHHSDNRPLEHSRSTPNLHGAYASSARHGHHPRERSQTVTGSSRNASGHIVQVEEVTTRVVTVQGQAQASRSRKGKDRALPLPPSWERDRQVALPVRRPPFWSSGHPSDSGPSSARSIQEVTTVRRRETWVSPSSSSRQVHGERRTSHRIQYPAPLWTSPPAGSSLHSSSTRGSSPLVRKHNRCHQFGSHTFQPRHSPFSASDANSKPRFAARENVRDNDETSADDPGATPSPKKRRRSAPPKPRPNPVLLLRCLPLWTVPPEGTLGYSSKLSIQAGKPRVCHACKSVSGDRARLAAYCSGRGRPHLCAFYEEGFDTTAEVLAVAREFTPLPPTDRLNSTQEVGRGRLDQKRHCRLCLDAGGQRSRRAGDCRGREQRRLCMHYNDDMSTPEAQHQAPEHMEADSTPTPAHLSLPPKDHPGYKQKLTVIKGVVRCCRACKAADGERRTLAGYCRGRDRPWHCSYYGAGGTAVGVPQTSGSDMSLPDLAKLEPVSTPTRALLPPMGHPGYSQEPLVIGDVMQQCQACKDAGGERGRLAGHCRGRAHPSFCSHIENGIVLDVAPEAADSALVSADVVREPPTAVPSSDHDGYFRNIALSRGTPRCCRACKGAGGDRAILAAYCKGRVRPTMCLQLDIKYGPSSINVPRTLNAVLAQAVPRPLSSDLAAFFEDKPPEDGEPTKSTAPPPTTRRFVLSPDSSRSDAENSSSDDSDDDRFSAYESPTADSNVDEGFEDDEDEDEDLSASEEEAKYAPSETDSDDSVLSTGYGGAQLLVDITPGVAANYTLPPDGRKFCDRLVFQEEGGAYNMAMCPRCTEAGEEHADRALWCPGRERGQECPLRPGTEVNPEPQCATASPVKEPYDLLTLPPSELVDDPLEPQNEDTGIRGYDIDNVTLDDVTSKQDVEPRIGRSRRPSSTPSSRSAVRILAARTSSLSGSIKSCPVRAAIAPSQRHPAPVSATGPAPRTAHVERHPQAPAVAYNLSPKQGPTANMKNGAKGKAKVPTLASSLSHSSYTLLAPGLPRSSFSQMLPPPLPRTNSVSSRVSSLSNRQNNHRAPRTTPRKRFHDPDSDSEPELPATAPRERSASVSWEPPLSTPRKKTRLERRAERVASMLEDNGSLEWGLDLEAGVEVARTFREGSILLPVSGRLQCGAGKGGKSAT